MPDLRRLRIREVRLLERPVRLCLSFRYGAVTLREAPQGFARVLVEAAGKTASGCAAEMLAPKWFDKDPHASDREDMDRLRGSLARAAGASHDPEPASAFGHLAALVPRPRNHLIRAARSD